MRAWTDIDIAFFKTLGALFIVGKSPALTILHGYAMKEKSRCGIRLFTSSSVINRYQNQSLRAFVVVIGDADLEYFDYFPNLYYRSTLFEIRSNS